jgi:hypothetical protein
MLFAPARFGGRYPPISFAGAARIWSPLRKPFALPPESNLLGQQEGTTGDTRKSSRANKAPESCGRPSPFLLSARQAVSGGPGGGSGGGLRAAGLRTTFLALTFLAGAFLMIFFAAVFLTDPFLAAAFFIGLFLAIALRAVFLTAPFFAVAFFATLFFAAAFLAGFLVVAFTMFKVPLLFLAG